MHVVLAAAAAAGLHAALPAAAAPRCRGRRSVHWRGAGLGLRQAAKVQVRLLQRAHAALQLAQLQALAQGLLPAAAGAAQPRCRQRVPRAPQRRAQPSAVRVQRSQLALGQRQLLGGGDVGLCLLGCAECVAACFWRLR